MVTIEQNTNRKLRAGSRTHWSPWSSATQPPEVTETHRQRRTGPYFQQRTLGCATGSRTAYFESIREVADADFLRSTSYHKIRPLAIRQPTAVIHNSLLVPVTNRASRIVTHR